MYDAIVVFGGGINPDGALMENSRVRVIKAIDLWRQKKAPVIAMSGAWSFSLEHQPARTEAAAMSEYAQILGYPAENIYLEEASKDTIGNAYYVKTKLAIPKNWLRLMIVVADYHVVRTRRICAQVFGPDYELQIVGAPLSLSPAERTERELKELVSLSLFNEWFVFEPGDHRQLAALLQSLHPGYSSHPKYSQEYLQQEIAARINVLKMKNQAHLTDQHI